MGKPALLRYMATNPIGKDRVQLACTVHKELGEFVLERASAMGATKGKFLRTLVEWWHAQGAPAISEADVGGKRQEWTKVAPFLDEAFKDDATFKAFETVMLETIERLRSARQKAAPLPEIDAD